MPKPKAKKPATHAVVNRRARFDYELGEEIVAGLVLTGPEVRAARDGHVQLKGAFVSLRNDELWLNNASFSLRLNVRGQANTKSVDTSARKLVIALGRGKKRYDKRETIKRRDQDRETRRQLSGR